MRPSELLRLAGIADRTDPIPLAGGDMGDVWKVGKLVLKTHASPPAGLYRAEARGLGLLEAKGVRVPGVRWVGDEGLILDYLEPGEPDWPALAKMIARLHRSKTLWYGSDRQEFIGRFKLPKAWGSSWKHYWLEHRIEPLLEATSDTLGDLRATLDPLLDRFDPPAEGPCLVHGDLWSGNVYSSAAGPCLIDPSAWCGERVVDLAMIELFGGFPPEFWMSYKMRYPIPPEVEAAIPYHQLYFLLVHVHFFGRGYLHGVRRVISTLRS